MHSPHSISLILAVAIALGLFPTGASAQAPDTTASSYSAAEQDAAKAAATDTVRSFLSLIDAGAFGEAYDRLRGKVPDLMARDAFIAELDSARQYIEAPASRDEPFPQFRPSMEQFDGGPFVTFIIEGEYELGTFSEFLLLRHDNDEAWHVLSYQIMPNMPVLRENEDLPAPLIDYPEK